MRHLGIGPGPEVGEAYRYLLDARIERGPLSEAQGYELLDAWAADRGP
jgi:poly(A) polymerase